jgi:hypothetical protein
MLLTAPHYADCARPLAVCVDPALPDQTPDEAAVDTDASPTQTTQLLTNLSNGSSTSHELQVTINHRLASGFNLRAAYTLGKTIDLTSGFHARSSTFTNPYDLSFDRGPADFDVHRRLVISGFYQLPSHRAGFGHLLINNWQVGGIAAFQTGTPFAFFSDNNIDPILSLSVPSVEDQFNRKHHLPSHEFRATPGPKPPPTAKIERQTPILHASWSGNSDWGWATARPKEDPIYMLRGEIMLLMDGIDQPVTITGVEIEGAEFMGKFDNFELGPDRPETRPMKLYFRGEAPKGIDDYDVRLVFKDLRGHRYPIVQHRFKPLPIPERVNVERGFRLPEAPRVDNQ